MKHFILFLVILFSTFTGFCTTIEVCKSCKTNSITKAIDMANSGDTINVQSGFYVEYNIKISKPLTLIGSGNPIIDGGKKGSIIELLGDSINIQGFIIQNVGRSYTKDFAAIHTYNSHHFKIVDNVLRDVFFGILVEKSKDGIINNNKVSSDAQEEYSSGNGIHLWHCNNITVTNNEVWNLRDGIYFEFVSESLITNNYSHDNLRYGLHFMFSNKDNYYDNMFVNNGAGVAVMFSKYINMKRNRFYHNWGSASFGLLLKEIYDAEITDNVFEENTIGINVEGSTRVNYVHNTLLKNGWAIKIAGGCYTNNFRLNNFISNSFDVSYNSKMNDNKFDDNYWSSYTGYDLDKDGVGDVPYRPVKLFSYIVNQTPETIILLRSLFIDILNFSEKVSPVFTPDNLMDNSPKMNQIHD